MSNMNSFGQIKKDNKLKYNYTFSQNYNIHYSNSSKSPSFNYIKNVNELQTKNKNYLNKYSNLEQNSFKEENKINYYRKLAQKNEINKKLNTEYSFQDTQKDKNHSKTYFSDINKKLDVKPTYTLKNTIERRINEKYQSNNNNKIINNKNRYNNNNNNITFKERKVTTYIMNKDKVKKDINELGSRREFTNKSYQGEICPPKYYRNNPLIRDENIKNKNSVKNDIKVNIARRVNTYRENEYDSSKSFDKVNYKIGRMNNKKIEYEDEYEDIERKYDITAMPRFQRGQSIEQNHKNSQRPNLIQKNLKLNTDFNLDKKRIVSIIQSQSFEEPKDFKSMIKSKKLNYISQLKNRDIEINGISKVKIDNEKIINYNTPTKIINQYQLKGKQNKNNNDILSIPKPNSINNKIWNKNSSSVKKNDKNISFKIINNRNHYIIPSKKGSSGKIDDQKQLENIKNNKSFSLISNLNNTKNQIGHESVINKRNKNNIKMSSRAITNLNINNINKEKNSNSIMKERSQSTQKYFNYIKPETTKNKHNTVIMNSPLKIKVEISKIYNIKNKRNNISTYNINENKKANNKREINEDGNLRAKSIDKINQNYYSQRNYSINSYENSKNKDKLYNKDNIYNNTSRSYINDINNYRKNKNEIQRKNSSNNNNYFNKNNFNKEIETINNHKSHTITIISNSGKNDLNNNKRVYIPKQNQNQNQKKEDKDNKNIGITFISNINNSLNKNITESSREKNNYKSLKAEPRKNEIYIKNYYSRFNDNNNSSIDNKDDISKSKINNNYNSSNIIYISSYKSKKKDDNKKEKKNNGEIKHNTIIYYTSNISSSKNDTDIKQQLLNNNKIYISTNLTKKDKDENKKEISNNNRVLNSSRFNNTINNKENNLNSIFNKSSNNSPNTIKYFKPKDIKPIINNTNKLFIKDDKSIKNDNNSNYSRTYSTINKKDNEKINNKNSSKKIVMYKGSYSSISKQEKENEDNKLNEEKNLNEENKLKENNKLNEDNKLNEGNFLNEDIILNEKNKLNEDNNKNLEVKIISNNSTKLTEDIKNEKELLSNNKIIKNDIEISSNKVEENKDILSDNNEKSAIKIEDQADNDISSDKKLENKIKELEEKLNNKLNLINYEIDKNKNKEGEEKTEEENIYEKYSFLNKPELSDITKKYLSSYTSGPRPELSDFSKAYMIGLTTNTTTRPELSNLTMEYLMKNTNDFNKEENK